MTFVIWILTAALILNCAFLILLVLVQLPKKEVGQLEKERERLEKYIGGLKNMGGLPSAVFIIDPHLEAIAVSEARKLHGVLPNAACSAPLFICPKCQKGGLLGKGKPCPEAPFSSLFFSFLKHP